MTEPLATSKAANKLVVPAGPGIAVCGRRNNFAAQNVC